MSAQPDNVRDINSKPSASVVFVTPDMAQRWLGQNTRNRKIRDTDVQRYARDMRNGAWELNGEAVKFGAAGELLDGQHRLAAIVQCGVTVPLFVIRGISAESQKSMDTGRKRTASDALQIENEKHSALLAATSRLALGVEDDLADPGKYEASHADIIEFLNRNPQLREAADFAHAVARRTDIPPAVVSYCYFRFAQIDRAAAAEFWVAAADKVGLSAGDPVIALTNRFAESRRNRERLPRRTQLSLVFRAWNARRAGKTMRFIRVNSPAGGLVPIPELHK